MDDFVQEPNVFEWQFLNYHNQHDNEIFMFDPAANR